MLNTVDAADFQVSMTACAHAAEAAIHDLPHHLEKGENEGLLTPDLALFVGLCDMHEEAALGRDSAHALRCSAEGGVMAAACVGPAAAHNVKVLRGLGRGLAECRLHRLRARLQVICHDRHLYTCRADV